MLERAKRQRGQCKFALKVERAHICPNQLDSGLNGHTLLL
jgi:hypothetical protein